MSKIAKKIALKPWMFAGTDSQYDTPLLSCGGVQKDKNYTPPITLYARGINMAIAFS